MSKESYLTPLCERLAVGAEEAAILLGICERSVINLKDDEKLPYTRIGRRIVYQVADLKRFLKENSCNREGWDKEGVV